jgi:dTDP-4-dehydrorhamnose 3,5-epimerase
MPFVPTELEGAFVHEPKRFEDERGFFAMAWSKKELEELGLRSDFAQSNMSFSKKKGTLRGLHYQRPPFQEIKLVRCTRGSIVDVIVDLRRRSPTYKKWFSIELTAENRRSLYIPEGFAHGLQTLEDDVEVLYHVSTPYSPTHAAGVRWNDPAFGIKWPLPPTSIIARDATYPAYRPEEHEL